MAGNFCSRHPDPPPRAVRGRTWDVPGLRQGGVPDVSMTPAEQPLLDPVVDDLVSQENQETAEHEL
jgi:hypothetical protein